MTVEQIAVLVFNLIVAGVIGQMLWSKRQDKKKLDDTHDDVIRLKERYATVSSDVHEIKVDTREIKRLVTDLQVTQGKGG